MGVEATGAAGGGRGVAGVEAGRIADDDSAEEPGSRAEIDMSAKGGHAGLALHTDVDVGMEDGADGISQPQKMFQKACAEAGPVAQGRPKRPRCRQCWISSRDQSAYWGAWGGSRTNVSGGPTRAEPLRFASGWEKPTLDGRRLD
jgi:hypothetical protein